MKAKIIAVAVAAALSMSFATTTLAADASQPAARPSFLEVTLIVVGAVAAHALCGACGAAFWKPVATIAGGVVGEVVDQKIEEKK